MANETFIEQKIKGNHGENFVRKYAMQITGIPLGYNQQWRMLHTTGNNAGKDIILESCPHRQDNIEMQIIDNASAIPRIAHGVGKTIERRIIEVKADLGGKFLGRNQYAQRKRLNVPCGTLGFEAYKDIEHHPAGWVYEYEYGEKWEIKAVEYTGDGRKLVYHDHVEQPTHLVFVLYLDEFGVWNPYATVCFEWAKVFDVINEYTGYHLKDDDGEWNMPDLYSRRFTIDVPWQRNEFHVPMDLLMRAEPNIMLLWRVDENWMRQSPIYQSKKTPNAKDYTLGLMKSRYEFLCKNAKGIIDLNNFTATPEAVERLK